MFNKLCHLLISKQGIGDFKIAQLTCSQTKLLSLMSKRIQPISNIAFRLKNQINSFASKASNNACQCFIE